MLVLNVSTVCSNEALCAFETRREWGSSLEWLRLRSLFVPLNIAYRSRGVQARSSVFISQLDPIFTFLSVSKTAINKQQLSNTDLLNALFFPEKTPT